MKQFGLTDKQAEESRQKYGDNSMTEQASESFWDKLKGNLGDPMIKILIVALLINVVLAVLGGVGIIKEGAPEWYEPLGIFVAIALATLVSTFSEYRNENAFQKLQEEASRIIKRANEEAILEKKRAMDEMKQEVIGIASMMAQKVVSASIDTTIQDTLVEETLKEMGDSTWQN